MQSGTEEPTFWRNLLPKEAESLSELLVGTYIPDFITSTSRRL